MKRFGLYGVCVCAAFMACATLYVHAAIPPVINYQSRLRTAGGVAVTAPTSISFALYTTPTGGAPLWSESYSQGSGACKKVTPDANGYFSLQMGSCTAFPATLSFTDALFLGVTIESDAEAVPRVTFAPAPYAMNAARVGTFVADTAANTLTGVPVGTATAGTQGVNSSALILQGSGWDGSAAQTKGFKMRTTATNASNYRFGIFDDTSGSEAISILNNGRVGIGVTNPQSELEVAGIIYANDFRTRGGTISTTGDGTNDLIRFTRPKLFIGHTASVTTPSPLTNLIELTATGVTFLEDASFEKLVSIPNRQIKFGANTFTFPVTAPASNGLVLTTASNGTLLWTAPSSGSVTSVGFTAPSTFSVTGSPITGAGSIGLSWVDQSANSIFAGPSSGAAGLPAFRFLDPLDIPLLDAAKITSGVFDAARIPTLTSGQIPDLDASKITSGIFAPARIPVLDIIAKTSGTLPVIRGGTGITSNAKGDIIFGDAANSLATLGIGTNGTVLTVDATGLPVWQALPAGSNGTVTSVAATVPSFLTITGSPITSAGTLAFDLANQAQGTVFMGPIAGPDSAPAFRGLVASDIPDLDAARITTGTFNILRIPDLSADKITSGTLAVARGGTGLSSVGTSGQVLTVVGGVPAWADVPASGGTVTSVGLSLPSLFSVTGSPVTTNGTLTAALVAQNRNKFFGGPVSGPDTVPDFRALDATDIPNLDMSKITTGVLGTAQGGTGLTTVGASGTVLTSVGGVPAWSAIPAGLNGTGTSDQIAFWNGSSSLAGSPQFTWDTTNNSLLIGGETTVAGNIIPSVNSTYDLGSPTRRFRNAHIDDLYIYGTGAGGGGGGTIVASSTIFNGVKYNWPAPPIPGDDFVLTTDTGGNLTWKNPAGLVPESGWRAAGGIVRLGVITDKVGIGTATPSQKLDVAGNINTSGTLFATGVSVAGVIRTTADIITNNLQVMAGNPGVGKVLTSDAIGNATWQTPASGGGGSGTVSSIGLTAPSIFTVTGTPVTTTGTIALSLASQSQNRVFASPDGIAGAPIFRALSGTDIPALDASKITTGVFSSARIPAVASSSIPDLDASKITSGIFNIARIPNIPAGNVTGVFASSSIPALDASKIATGILPVVRGGTGLSAIGAAGTVLTSVGGVPAWQTPAVSSISGNGTGRRIAAWNGTWGNPATALRDSIMYEATGGTPMITVAGDLEMTGNFRVGGTKTAIADVEYTWPTTYVAGRVLTVGANGVLSWNAPSGGMGGSGTVNTLPMFTASGTIGNSIVTQAGGGIQVGGAITANGITINNLNIPTGAAAGKILTSDGAGNAFWQTPSSSGLPASVAASTVLAGPIGAAGAPAFRGLTALDVPALDVSKLTTGTLPVARGGTGLSSVGASGQILTVVSGVPAWADAPAGAGEGATYVGNKTITGTLAVGTTTITGALNLNKSALIRDGQTILDTAGNSYLNSLTVNGGMWMNGTMNVRQILPQVDNLYELGSATKRFVSAYAGSGDMNYLTVNNSLKLPMGAGAGKVLTSDATGNASWQTSAGSSGNGTFSQIDVSGQTATQTLTVRGTTSLVGDAAIGVFGGNAKLTVNGSIGQKGQVLGIDSVTGVMKWQTAGSSDRRLKENITELSGVLGKLDAIHGVNFTWKADKDKKKQLGVIAQDVEKAFPELVDTDAQTGMKSVDYPALAAVAIQGLKELDMKVDALIPVTGVGVIRTGESEVSIATSQVFSGAKIFITPVGSTGGQVLYVDTIIDGKSFTVKTDKAVRSPVRFNWIIMK